MEKAGLCFFPWLLGNGNLKLAQGKRELKSKDSSWHYSATNNGLLGYAIEVSCPLEVNEQGLFALGDD